MVLERMGKFTGEHRPPGPPAPRTRRPYGALGAASGSTVQYLSARTKLGVGSASVWADVPSLRMPSRLQGRLAFPLCILPYALLPPYQPCRCRRCQPCEPCCLWNKVQQVLRCVGHAWAQGCLGPPCPWPTPTSSCPLSLMAPQASRAHPPRRPTTPRAGAHASTIRCSPFLSSSRGHAFGLVDEPGM